MVRNKKKKIIKKFKNKKKNDLNEKQELKDNKENDIGNTTDIDDEIIDIDDVDNGPEKTKTIASTLVKCHNCIFAFFKDKKKFNDKVTEYTKDYASLKDEKGYQKGTENGSAFQYNIGILNQVFSTGCSYNFNNTRYTCIGETNGDTRTDGYVSVHYDDNCHVFEKTVYQTDKFIVINYIEY